MKTILDIDELVFSPPELSGVLYLPGYSGGGNKIHDRSPYANVGTITGATWQRLPSGLWYLDFDGNDDCVNCGEHSSLDMGTDDFSLRVWVKSSDCPADRTIIGKMNWADTGYNIFVEGNKARFYLRDGVNVASITGTSVIIDDKWHLVEGTKGEGYLYLYVDGKADATKADCSAVGSLNNSRDFYVGCAANPTAYFRGFIALPSLIRQFRTEFDAQQTFNEQKHLFGVW